ncbi:hypothetical protein DHEL01_v210160 [Diaporthe helianthi]|uniref:Uncharacterized protein n=1 Tax=Diaporthe helianthi TaxID=158607 RepID=A0A2P5HMJ4_DIAHE|nr:hypothetical protein DHEL01_v210160 [Diaporthe helianthi]
MRHTISILAVLASTALAGDIQARDDCVVACNTAWDTCRGQPDANRASCAADFAGCVGYNPFESGTFEPPTACVSMPSIVPAPVPAPPSASAHPTPTPSAPANPCVAACDKAYDACRSKPDANRAACASEYAGCLGYNPFDGSGSLVTPTACSSVPVISSSAAPNATATKTMIPPPANSTLPVVISGAENLKPMMALLAGVGTFALL